MNEVRTDEQSMVNWKESKSLKVSTNDGDLYAEHRWRDRGTQSN